MLTFFNIYWTSMWLSSFPLMFCFEFSMIHHSFDARTSCIYFVARLWKSELNVSTLPQNLSLRDSVVVEKIWWCSGTIGSWSGRFLCSSKNRLTEDFPWVNSFSHLILFRFSCCMNTLAKILLLITLFSNAVLCSVLCV